MTTVQPAPAGIEVTAPARLHLGFLDPDGDLGRRFGSIGLAVEWPVTRLRVSRAPRLAASGFEPERAQALLTTLCETLALPDGYSVAVSEAIPAHAGFGSGTQLALAIGAGLMALTGQPLSLRDLAMIAERGARSAIGLAAFEQGGFVVDGGRAPGAAPPPVTLRLPFPPDWRILLALDPSARGLQGEPEKAAFRALPRFSAAASGELCRLLLLRLLPGLVEHDLAAFGDALTHIQAMLGDYFAPAQGGNRWTSPKLGRLIARCGALGATGLGQTSWGPTGYAFVASQAEAERLRAALAPEAAAAGLELAVTQGRNQGARLAPFSP